MLAFLLPVATREELFSHAAARKLVLSVAALIVITGLTVEGAGAVIEHGLKSLCSRRCERRSIMNSATAPESPKLKAATRLRLAAAIARCSIRPSPGRGCVRP